MDLKGLHYSVYFLFSYQYVEVLYGVYGCNDGF